ncbi:MAG: hypothetical protein CMJ52_03410 [Planctomycetaceae bacterium]|nr:hypothetical protein [Planctomycetaceae bacterium]
MDPVIARDTPSGDNPAMPDATFEIPVEDPKTAVVAAKFADRLEICRALDRDGLTPSPTLVVRIREAIEIAGIPAPRLATLFQERPPPPDRRRCEADIFRIEAGSMRRLETIVPEYASLGVETVVVGFLDSKAEIDFEACAEAVEIHRTHGLETAFHRAFDFTPDPAEALSGLSRAGVCRTLSAGVRGFEIGGVPEAIRIERLRSLAVLGCSLDPPVEVVPCGGIRSRNARGFLEAAGHLHASCRAPAEQGREAMFDRREAAGLRGLVHGDARA